MSSNQSSLGDTQPFAQRLSQFPSKSNPNSHSANTKGISPYDGTFQQHLIDHKVFPDGHTTPDDTTPPEPENMNDILQAMAQRRRSLSPSKFSDDDFRKFRRMTTSTHREADVAKHVIPLVEGEVPDLNCTAVDVLFKNLESLTDGTIVPAKPDIYHGARPEHLDIKVRRDQTHMVIPSTPYDEPTMPNFFLQAKRPEGTHLVASHESCYNGALGARGMHSLQSYGQPKQKYDNKAYTISAVYIAGTLSMYTSHPIPPRTPGGIPGFAMTHMNSWAVAGNADTFRQVVAAFRNARDWAKQQRDEAIDWVNERAAESHGLQ